MKFPRIIQQFLAAIAIITGFNGPALAGPATAEEQARVVQLALTADADPVGTMTSADGRWFEKWAEETPDFMFGPDAGAFWFMSGAAKGDLRRVLRFHHTVSIAAFQVKNQIMDPMKNPAHFEAKTLAGVEGVLRAYETLLVKNPENRSAQIDEAIAVRNKGGLADFVKALPPMPKR
jgi:carboxypeptidase Q